MAEPITIPATPRRPLDMAAVTKIAAPAQKWANVLSRVTPLTLISAIQAANMGDMEAYLTLACEAEERFGHYASVLQTRKLAIQAAEIEVESGDGSEAGQKIADAFRESVVDDTCFAELVLDLMDGVAKGFSVVQPHWDFTTTPWSFHKFEFVDQRFFCFDKETQTELRIRSADNFDGIPVRPGQFVLHKPRTRSATPNRSGFIRPISVCWMIASATVSQWTAMTEVFGMPLRIGKYDPETVTDHEIEQLKIALRNLGTDAAAILPRAMELEILDGRRPPSGDNIFAGLNDWAERTVSKIVLGGTMTSDDGSSLAQAKVHNDVRLDIKRADARSIEGTIRTQVAAAWTLYNYGPFAPIPKIKINVEPAEDLDLFSKAITPLITAGLSVSAQEVRAKFGLRDPKAGEEIIEAKAPPVDPNKAAALAAKPAVAPAPGAT